MPMEALSSRGHLGDIPDRCGTDNTEIRLPSYHIAVSKTMEARLLHLEALLEIADCERPI